MNTTCHRISALVLSFSTVAVLALSGCTVADEVEAAESNDLAVDTGNGSVSGAHYNLNIIGMSSEKSATMDGNNGQRIFVPLQGSTKILLNEGDFQVIDANGTDGTAKFSLPAPDPDGDGTSSYSVFARALGKPGGQSTTTTCATDPVTGELWCSTEQMVLVRKTGLDAQKFTNVSKQLLTIVGDFDGDGTTESKWLFDDSLIDYYWAYDNKGLRLAQLRFYEIPYRP